MLLPHLEAAIQNQKTAIEMKPSAIIFQKKLAQYEQALKELK